MEISDKSGQLSEPARSAPATVTDSTDNDMGSSLKIKSLVAGIVRCPRVTSILNPDPLVRRTFVLAGKVTSSLELPMETTSSHATRSGSSYGQSNRSGVVFHGSPG